MGKIFILFSFFMLMSCGRNSFESPVVSNFTESENSSQKKICASVSLSSSPATGTQQENAKTQIPLDLSYDNYIVKFKNDSGLKQSGNKIKEYTVDRISLSQVYGSLYSFKISGSLNTKQNTIDRLKKQENVDYIEPDFPISSIIPSATSQVPDDPYFSKQWFHSKLDSLSAWSVAEGSQDLVVAVVDTGIDYTHPDLKENIWQNPEETINGRDDDGNGFIDDIYGWNFSANTNDARTTTVSPHGSHVAGLIGATGRNHIGVVGIAPKVKMMALKFIDDSGTGLTSNAIKAINYAIDKKVFLINNSWGSSLFSKGLSEAIARAANANILFFAAAGNGSKGIGYDIDNKPWYPASYPYWNVLSVAATDNQDQLTRFSNFSKNKVAVAAPGFSIFSTISGQGYQSMSGTSMATPIVSGLAVLIKAANSKLGSLEILNIIKNSSDKISGLTNKVTSGGRINSYKALLMAQTNKVAEKCASY